MFYREGDGADERVVGVLTDWDQAEEYPPDYDEAQATEADMERLLEEMQSVDKQGMDKQAGSKSDRAEVQMGFGVEPPVNQQGGAEETEDGEDEGTRRRRAKYRTGTGPFMAIELLRLGPTPRHLYRHDLESFFWTLSWFCAGFRPDKNEVDIIPSWHQGNLVDVGFAKTQFVDHKDVFMRIFSQTHEAYKPFVYSGWIQYLVDLFQLAQQASLQMQIAVEAYERVRDLPNPQVRAVRLAHARARLDSARKELQDLITYESFMMYLNIDVV